MKIKKVTGIGSYVCLLLFMCHKIESSNNEYRIAFVKQVVYQDLYVTQSSNPSEIVFSSFKRSGPVALFSALNSDFFIVETEPDPECAVWKEKAILQLGIPFYESLRTTIPRGGIVAGHTHPQGYYAVNCSAINWGNYDIVISVDIAVPARITKQYPKTLWAYYIGEGCKSFTNSFNKPIDGYDVFLSQDYSEKTQYKEHVIEFPYHLHYFGCFHELMGRESLYPRNGISLEIHTGSSLEKEQITALNNISPICKKAKTEAIRDHLARLMKTKYFIVFLTQKQRVHFIRGNSIPEAIAAGNLVIALKKCLKNISLLSDNTLVDSFEELVEKLHYFEKNPDAYAKELEDQRQKLNWFCYTRPIGDLYKHCKCKKALAEKIT